MQLKGKTALVTGSTSGIGLAMAKAMAAQGANVMMNGFGEKDAAIAEVKAYGVEVDYHGADMSKPDEIAQMIAATEKRFGAIDVLINNAGIQHVASVKEYLKPCAYKRSEPARVTACFLHNEPTSYCVRRA